MSSKQIEAVNGLYRSWGAVLAANPSMPLDEWRDMIEGWVVLAADVQNNGRQNRCRGRMSDMAINRQPI
jgi:hypothetical protein